MAPSAGVSIPIQVATNNIATKSSLNFLFSRKHNLKLEQGATGRDFFSEARGHNGCIVTAYQF